MPRIASHHKVDPWRPLLGWPDACEVQWGGSGLVIGRGESYGTAFFEAFPGDGVAGFIRGEGPTVEDAEAACFAKFERERDCFASGGHLWGRGLRHNAFEDRRRKGRCVPKVTMYLNGGAHCLRCGAFKSAFPSVHQLGHWRRPLSNGDLSAIMGGTIRHDPRLAMEDRDGSARRWKRYLFLRARWFGIRLPDHDLPAYAIAPDASFLVEDAYTRECREAVVRFHISRRDQAQRETHGELDGFFDAVARRSLDAQAELYLAKAGKRRRRGKAAKPAA